MCLVDVECIFKEFLLFLDVHGLETGSHRRTGGTTSVEDVATVVVFRSVQQGLNTRLGVAPGTRVQRLFLRPHNVLGVGVAVKVLLELGPGEGVQLLNTCDSGVADALGLAVLDESSVHLTRAQDHTFDLLGFIDGGPMGGVRDDPLEVRVASELAEVRASKRVAQEGLGEEHHQSWEQSQLRRRHTKQQRMNKDLRLRNWRWIWRRIMWNMLAGLVM